MIRSALQQRPHLDTTTRFVIALLWISLGIFVLYPALRLLGITFWADGRFTLANFSPVITNWYDRMALFNSLLLGCSVAVAGTVLGFILKSGL